MKLKIEGSGKINDLDTERTPLIFEVSTKGGKGKDAEWVKLTQAQYDAIIPDESVLYLIVG